jgi:AraC-like DNA-binding protein
MQIILGLALSAFFVLIPNLDAFKNTYGISPSEYRKQNHIIKKDDE